MNKPFKNQSEKWYQKTSQPANGQEKGQPSRPALPTGCLERLCFFVWGANGEPLSPGDVAHVAQLPQVDEVFSYRARAKCKKKTYRHSHRRLRRGGGQAAHTSVGECLVWPRM